jgi:hypothetical protein
MSGVIVASTSFTLLALLGGALALALIPIVVMTHATSTGRAAAA